METKSDQKQKSSLSILTQSVTISTLIIILLSSTTGVIFTLLVIRATSTAPETFSTSELVSFLFGIALSSASIVLAIAAISLGKASEQAMVQRSDESLRLQSEIFTRTTDALQRIESSTGVTEKRIEDIISGRASAISDRIVDRLIEDRSVQPKKRKDLEREVRESLVKEVTLGSKPESKEKIEKEKAQRIVKIEAYEGYHLFAQEILLGLSNMHITKSIKIGDGSFDTQGDDLVDGVYEVKGKRIGISVFSTNEHISDTFNIDGGFEKYIFDLGAELAKKHFDKILLIFDCNPSQVTFFGKAIERFKTMTTSTLSDQLMLFFGSKEQILSEIVKYLDTIPV